MSRTATFTVSPARHGRTTRDLLAHLNGQTVTVLGPSHQLGHSKITPARGGSVWTVLDSELSVSLVKLNVWGDDIANVDTSEFCARCEREVPRHYANCDSPRAI